MPLHLALQGHNGIERQTLSWIMMQTVPALQPPTAVCLFSNMNMLKRQTRIKDQGRRSGNMIMIGKIKLMVPDQSGFWIHPAAATGDRRVGPKE